MKLPQLQNRKWNYPALAFALPFTAFLVLMMVVGCTPFGDRSLLYSDMWHQYFPFFKAFRLALKRGDSLLYSWNVGLGMDYLGLISYYLASPLNLLSVLVPDSWVLPYFSLLTPLKLGLASLFFAIFLKNIFRRDDFSIVLFGSFYGLCAWALGYQWNIMWLDTFALLPLVALGTVFLLRDRKFILYTVTLFLSIFSNYYIGFFTCIFVLLLFICYQICRCKSGVRFFRDLLCIALFSILAIGMTAVLELPALAALGNTQSSVNSFPNNFSLNIVPYADCADAREAWNNVKMAKEAGELTLSLWLTAVKESFKPVFTGMAKVAGNMPGGISPTFKEGLPNIYCGVSTIILAFLSLTSRQVKLRDKLCSVFLLLFFMASFVIRQLDYIWHGFHFTNMIPYRFSFLYSFVMLYMAYRAWLLRNRFRTWQIVLAGLLTMVILLLPDIVQKIPAAMEASGEMLGLLGQVVAASAAGNKDLAASTSKTLQSLYNTHGDAIVYLAFNTIFFGLYLALLLYPRMHKALSNKADRDKVSALCRERRSRRALAGSLFSFMMVLELIMNVVNFGVNFSYTNITTYPRGNEYTASMIRYMKEREDSLFYRAEATHTQTLNDGALNDYNGISTFTSSANVKVTEFMQALGYGAKNTYNRYCFEESSPVANLFLNLKYMLERQGNVEDNPYFTEIHHYGDVYLLENNAYLPLGFLANKELAELDFSAAPISAFQLQNALFSDATGLTEPVWNTTSPDWLTITGENVDITLDSGSGYCSYKTSSGGKLIYSYAVEDDGFLCVDLTMSARNNYAVYLNGTYLFSESISLPQTLAISNVKAGDVVELRMTCKANETSNMTIRAALLDDKVFRSGYEILAASTLELKSFSNTKVTGTISCNRDGLLYTSIPHDGNWYATVDGHDAQIVPVGDAMVALNLTKGDHEIVFTYRNSAFSAGLAVSLVCLAVFLVLVYFQNRSWCDEKLSRLKVFLKRK